MINGKFFTGLPPKMMDRNVKGPDRQQSHLFWPDESDAESASDGKTRRQRMYQQQSPAQQHEYIVNSEPDIEPKELFKKQLTSNIGFYDMDDTSSSPAKYYNTPDKNKQFQNTSKIEFYDYVDNKQPHDNYMTTNKNSKKDLERNTKNSPKLVDKRIQFIDIQHAPEPSSNHPKSILRNNVTNVKSRTGGSGNNEPARRKLNKKSLSKSYENLSSRARDSSDDDDDYDRTNVIENNVRDMKIEISNPEAPSWNHTRKQCKAAVSEVRSSQVVNNGVVEAASHISRHAAFNDGWESPEQIDEGFFRKGGRDSSMIIQDPFGRIINERHHNIVQENSSYCESPSPSTTRPRNVWQFNNRLEPEKSVNQNHAQPITSTPEEQQQQQPRRSNRHLISSINFGGSDSDSSSRPAKARSNAAGARVTVGLPD